MNEIKLPKNIPVEGTGEAAAFHRISDQVMQHSAHLGAPDAFAHMDPWPDTLAAELVGLNAKHNQNMLHPDLSPFASIAEAKVIEWLCPFFDMHAGHMCSGSTIANLTALWAARENSATKVITSADAHISVPKSAAILQLPIELIPVDESGRINTDAIHDYENAAVVLTAGTTGRGVVDPLDCFDKTGKKPLWLHVDAAWAGPLRLTQFKDKLNGIEFADSVSISAHKWFFQPKDSAVILFKDAASVDAISFGSSYLASPNIGVQGSRGAAAIPLLGTLMSLGVNGIDSVINKCMKSANDVAKWLDEDDRIQLKQFPETGVINWRPVASSAENADSKTQKIIDMLGRTASSTRIDGQLWVRHVSANVNADVNMIVAKIQNCLAR